MRKFLVITFVILILAGLGYFAYSKGLVNLGFLQKGEVVEDVAVAESQQESPEKIEDRIHPLCFTYDKITVEDCKHFFQTDKVEKGDDGFYSAEQSIYDEEMAPKGSIEYRIIGEKDNKIFAQVVDWNGGIGDGSTQSSIEVIEQVGDYYVTNKIAGGGYPCHDPVWRDSVKMKDNFIEYTQTNLKDVFGEQYFSGLKFSCFAVGEFRYDILKNKIELISAELLDPNQNDVYLIALEQDGDIEDACFRDVFLSHINQKKFVLNLKEIDEFKNKINICISTKNAKTTIQTNDHIENIISGGYKRSYLIHVPVLNTKSEYKVIVAFHGYGGTASGFTKHTGFSELADKNNFIIVYPESYISSWADGRNMAPEDAKGINDVQFVRDLVADVEKKYPIDKDHIFATGFSSGGFFTHKLACEATDIFKAFAPVGAGFPDTLSKSCNPIKSRSILTIQGSNDDDGGVTTSGVHVYSAEDTFVKWSGMNECTDQILNTGEIAQIAKHNICKGGTRVFKTIIIREGHSWVRDDVFDTSATIMEFFKNEI